MQQIRDARSAGSRLISVRESRRVSKFRALARGTHATSVAVEEALFWGLSPSSPVENKQHPVHANLFLLTLAWEQRLAGTPGSVTSRVGSGWAHKDLRPVKQPRLRSLVGRRFEPRSGRESRGTGVCHASQSVGKLAGLARETTFEYRHKPPHFSGSGIMTPYVGGRGGPGNPGSTGDRSPDSPGRSRKSGAACVDGPAAIRHASPRTRSGS